MCAKESFSHVRPGHIISCREGLNQMFGQWPGFPWHDNKDHRSSYPYGGFSWVPGPFLFGLLVRIVWPQIASDQRHFSHEDFCTSNLKLVPTKTMILSHSSRPNNPNPASLYCICLRLQEFKSNIMSNLSTQTCSSATSYISVSFFSLWRPVSLPAQDSE